MTTIDPINGCAPSAILFGPFRLLTTQRLLLKADRPVRLGSRALDMLIALVKRPGELVTKRELMRVVWPDTVVVEANLTVHVAALRRALGDGRAGNRYVVNIPGRGYRFVAPVTIAQDLQPSAPPAAAVERTHNLPTLLTDLIGRADIVDEVVDQLPQGRFITIAGPGGIGKTAVALAVAQRLIGSYEHGVWLVDLAAVTDPLLVPSALAAVLELESRSNKAPVGLIAALRDKRMLLVLDNCEHVIASAAALVASVLKGAPGLHVLATSREPLRVEGERVHRLTSLETPPASPRLSAAEARAFSAVQLFVERAGASSGGFEFSDAAAPTVAEICRRLDGIPLAIEFAAAKVGIFRVEGLASRLDDCLRLLTGGRRTALPRHQSMSATLDWSYGLLTETEQTALRRLAIFASDFTLGAAGAVSADMAHPESEMIDAIIELVAKSLVTVDVGSAEPRFRLLETTRAYALAKLRESGEIGALVRRHARFCRNLLEPAARNKAAGDDWLASSGPELENIRAAPLLHPMRRGDRRRARGDLGACVVLEPILPASVGVPLDRSFR